MIERLRELEKAATPAPWSEDQMSPDTSYHDAALIAEARNALPLLLDVVEALEAVTVELEHTITPRPAATIAALRKARAALAALTDTVTDTGPSKESSDEGKSGPS